MKTKCSCSVIELSSGPVLNRKPVKLNPPALDDDRPLYQIDEDIGLRASGQLDLLGQNTRRFLKGGGIVDVDILERFGLCRPREGKCRQKKREKEKAGDGLSPQLH